MADTGCHGLDTTDQFFGEPTASTDCSYESVSAFSAGFYSFPEHDTSLVVQAASLALTY